MDGKPEIRPAAFARYVARAGEGPNSLPRILIGTAIVVAVWFSGTFALFTGVAVAAAYGLLPWIALPTGANPVLAVAQTRLGFALGVLSIAAMWPGVWLALRFLHKRRLATLYGAEGRIDRNDFARAALVTLGVAVLFSVLNMAIEPTTARSALALGTWLLLLPAMALVLLLQTSAEEVLFRGYLMQALAQRFRSPVIWALAPTLVFASAHWSGGAKLHMNGLIVFAITLFALAAVLLVRATGNLGAAMGMHFGNNLVAVLFLSSSPDDTALALFVTPPVDDSVWTVGDAAISAVFQALITASTLGLLLSRRSPWRLRSRAAPAGPAPASAP